MRAIPKSNKALQASISKHGLDNFHFYVYEYFSTIDGSGNNLLTDLETIQIKKFNHITLYNFMSSATNLTG